MKESPKFGLLFFVFLNSIKLIFKLLLTLQNKREPASASSLKVASTRVELVFPG